jgi:hypothetical protein
MRFLSKRVGISVSSAVCKATTWWYTWQRSHHTYLDTFVDILPPVTVGRVISQRHWGSATSLYASTLNALYSLLSGLGVTTTIYPGLDAPLRSFSHYHYHTCGFGGALQLFNRDRICSCLQRRYVACRRVGCLFIEGFFRCFAPHFSTGYSNGVGLVLLELVYRIFGHSNTVPIHTVTALIPLVRTCIRGTQCHETITLVA